MVRESSQLRLSIEESEYVVPAGVYYWKGLQDVERDSLIARVQHGSKAVVLSYDNTSRAMGLPKASEDVADAFCSSVKFFAGSGRVVIVSDGPMTIDYAIGALGYVPEDLRKEVGGGND